MEERDESNYELETPDIFTVVNNYFLLFFGIACVMSSIYLQGLFVFLDQLRIGISVSSLVGIIIPMYLFFRRSPLGFKQQLRILPPKSTMGVYVILATIMSIVTIDFIYIISQRMFPVPTEFTESLKTLKPEGAGAVAITFLGLCVVVPFAEELVFRGLVQQVFTRNMDGVLAFIMAGLFFGVVHLSAHLLISVSLFGILLGFIFYATKNLTYTILSHAVFNAVSFIQLVTTPADHLDDPPFYIQDTRLLVASVVFLAFFLVKIKKGDTETETP
ncbi:MAG: CPBP family intramembrane metalloprotease [Candidatus Latescibacteria bacterium]|nr:CPBP family intramembrane metalloprotease [Candidatus Latescibacterota bacterium]NIM22603.1 CPBP family intramembrane metalloprotease [Candidatus Latescibacterota bacterium]NIM64892.1 CPBP family intramembrane metalloprotease [Candidatus Latescibacterota bacterium]NIO01407.1 CPBP family intramembrane metalloprotease [Candidatus Latescibacterota bacterium]NIO27917.1 CPBP family intramembrane metalloprotease [Candidatus Latescibacterota bacterium]